MENLLAYITFALLFLVFRLTILTIVKPMTTLT